MSPHSKVQSGKIRRIFFLLLLLKCCDQLNWSRVLRQPPVGASFQPNYGQYIFIYFVTSLPPTGIDTPPSTTSPSPSSFSLKRERSSSPPDEDDLESTGRDIKRRVIGDCDEEINAQVQSAIDSILNLQRSDPATDEAVRSILSSGVSS